MDKIEADILIKFIDEHKESLEGISTNFIKIDTILNKINARIDVWKNFKSDPPEFDKLILIRSKGDMVRSQAIAHLKDGIEGTIELYNITTEKVEYTEDYPFLEWMY